MSLDFNYSLIATEYAWNFITTDEEAQERYGRTMAQLVESSKNWCGIPTWDWYECNGERTNCIKQMNLDLHALIWATMAIGINEITEKNVRKVFTRIYMWESRFGALRHEYIDNGQQPRPFTFERVYRYIGLRTNASKKTDHKFRKQLADDYLDDLVMEADMEMPDTTEAFNVKTAV